MPPRQPWLLKLDELLRKLSLPLQAVATRHGSLLLWLDQGQPDSFVVSVTPRSSASQGWTTTDRFVVAYSGARDLDPRTQGWLSLIAGLLRRIEAKLPATFDRTDGVFAPYMLPEDRFLRLFPFCMVERSSIAGQEVVEVLIRATSLCNQRCPFCSAPDQDSPDHATLMDAIVDAASLFPGATLSLTGGEPTLRPDFAAELSGALAIENVRQVQVQTNAVAFASRLDPAAWEPSPRLMFFVSLHATDPDIYDRCTGTRGQLPVALEGMRRMIAAGHQVTLNCVVSSENLAHLPAYVQSLPGLLPIGDKVDLHFSSLICHERKPEASTFLVRYPELASTLERVASIAASLNVPVQSLLSSTHASLPACLLSEEYRLRSPHRPTLRQDETGFEDFDRPWVKALRCRDCVHADHCLGVPRAYGARFGLDELTPIREG
ncbi:MAG: radical SAM protein [Deltaproteobacteria bacterium]|nr:radical SAM protein [Deltaproteobacteria bacterium]